MTMPVVDTYPILRLKIRKVETDPLMCSDGASWYRVSRLGEGGFGTVYLANTQETHGLPYQIAVKSCLLSKSSSLQYEKQVLCDLQDCSDVIKCYGEEVTETSGGDKVYNILLEYCSGLSLESKIKKRGKIPEVFGRSYTRDVVRGLRYMHAHGYAHCDIKPDNILLVPSRSSRYGAAAKIADFGLAAKIQDEWEINSVGLRGTLCYMSPEKIKESRIDYAGDIWALGCTIVEMVNGEDAWEDCYDSDQLIQQIVYTDRVPQIKSCISNYISDDCKDFISKCLARNVAERWTAEKLLQHPFLEIDGVRNEPHTEVATRQSTRQRRRPLHLQDYECAA